MLRISIVLLLALNASSYCTCSDFCWNFLSWYISLFLNQLLHCSVAWEPWMQGSMDHRRWERLSCRGWCNLSVSSLHEYMNTKRHDVNVYVLNCTSTYAHCTDICCIKPQICQDHKLSSLCWKADGNISWNQTKLITTVPYKSTDLLSGISKMNPEKGLRSPKLFFLFCSTCSEAVIFSFVQISFNKKSFELSLFLSPCLLDLIKSTLTCFAIRAMYYLVSVK